MRPDDIGQAGIGVASQTEAQPPPSSIASPNRPPVEGVGRLQAPTVARGAVTPAESSPAHRASGSTDGRHTRTDAIRTSARSGTGQPQPAPRGLTALLIAAAVIAPLIVALAVLGAYASFTAIRDLAEQWFGPRAWTIPVGIDVGILVLLAGDLILECFDFGWPVLRWVAWGFIGVTVYLNIASADHTAAAALMQVAMPILFITTLEGVRHLVRRVSGLTSGRHIDRIPTARRLYAPWASLTLHRRMVLWHVSSYRQALRLEYEHLLAVSSLQERYGRWLWRWRAPLRERLALRLQAARFADLHNGPNSSPLTPNRTLNSPASTHSQMHAVRHIPTPHNTPPAPPAPPPKAPPSKATSPDGKTAAYDPKDAELIAAARAIATEFQQQQRRLTQIALADRLRSQGLTIANDRLGWLARQIDLTGNPPTPLPET